ncbi:MAG: DJ-1/PfpI family protein [Pyrinomonadaceae bacterium]|nr:DJ-1/PfpI family protein [Pyrinomonadaceae bacterium]
MSIAILLFDKMTALDAVGPYEVLSRLPNSKVYFVGETKGRKTTDTKMLSFDVDYSIDDVPNPNVLLIPGGNVLEVIKSEKVLNWIRNANKTTRFTTSVCTGSIILGAAGLLKGQKATTHWATVKYLQNFGAEYVAERYVQTGQNGKIITAAGVSAGIDMGLFLAGKLSDERTAKMIQLAIEYDPQPPFNSGSAAKAEKQTVADALEYFQNRSKKEKAN